MFCFSRNDVVLSLTFHELRKVNTCRSPADKLDCIVQCCTVLFNVLNLSRVSAEDRPSADDFLPALIYVVLHSRVSTLYSNVEFILKYRNPADMITKWVHAIAIIHFTIFLLLFSIDQGFVLPIFEELLSLFWTSMRHKSTWIQKNSIGSNSIFSFFQWSIFYILLSEMHWR